MEVEIKRDNTPVTRADKEAETLIREYIGKYYPSHSVIGEEHGRTAGDADYRWIIDPIDGTVNFANGIPICCVSVGLEYQGNMLMGAVFNPNMNEFYLAEKGKGATLNGHKISVSNKAEVIRSCLVTGFPYNYLDIENGPLEVFQKLIKLKSSLYRIIITEKHP